MISILAKVEGIIVKETLFKETSKILTVFTKEGMIGIIAKGANRPKMNYTNLTSKLTYGVFHINKRPNLSTLIEVDLIDNFKYIRQDMSKISYSLFITNLVTQIYEQNQVEDIYNIYICGLKKINEGYDEHIITNILEIQLLKYLGIGLVIDKCISCNKNTDIVTISAYKGGLLCKDCVNDNKVYNTKTMKLIIMFHYIDITKITKLDISKNIRKEINEFINEYYDRYSGLYLQTKEFLNKL